MQSSSSCPLPSTWTSKIGQAYILSHFLSDGLSKGGDNTESLVNPYRVLRQYLYRFHVCLYVFAGRLSLRQHEDFFISLESEFSDLEGVSMAEVFTEACLMTQYAQGRLMGTVEESMSSIIARICTTYTSDFLIPSHTHLFQKAWKSKTRTHGISHCFYALQYIVGSIVIVFRDSRLHRSQRCCQRSLVFVFTAGDILRNQ